MYLTDIADAATVYVCFILLSFHMLSLKALTMLLIQL